MFAWPFAKVDPSGTQSSWQGEAFILLSLEEPAINPSCDGFCEPMVGVEAEYVAGSSGREPMEQCRGARRPTIWARPAT